MTQWLENLLLKLEQCKAVNRKLLTRGKYVMLLYVTNVQTVFQCICVLLQVGNRLDINAPLYAQHWICVFIGHGQQSCIKPTYVSRWVCTFKCMLTSGKQITPLCLCLHVLLVQFLLAISGRDRKSRSSFDRCARAFKGSSSKCVCVWVCECVCGGKGGAVILEPSRRKWDRTQRGCR